MRTFALPLLVGALSLACRSPNPATAPAPAEPPPPSANVDGAATAASTDATSAPALAPSAGDGEDALPSAADGAVAVASPPGEPLPEVRVRNVGLHVGGGPNDAATKAPFQAAIAERFDDFRRCYSLIATPGKGGVFGVDLRIPREGGRATVQGARTGMGGTSFRDCVVAVFTEVSFAPPSTGTTVISYSLEFSVGEG